MVLRAGPVKGPFSWSQPGKGQLEIWQHGLIELPEQCHPRPRARAGRALAHQRNTQLGCNQPNYSMLWRVIEHDVLTTCPQLGIGQVVFSPTAQGVLTGKSQPGQPPPAGSRATDEKSGANFIARLM